MISLAGNSEYLDAEFEKTASGLVFDCPKFEKPFDIRSGLTFQSNGGHTRKHLARVCPFSCEFPLPKRGVVQRVHLVGVFAMYADLEKESRGTIGASVQMFHGKDLVHRVELVNGRHYADAFELNHTFVATGDGCEVTQIGIGSFEDEPVRVDCVSIDVPFDELIDRVVFKDLGSPASFVISQCTFQIQPSSRCPFHSQGGGIPLSELGSIIRLRDRARFKQAREQFETSLEKTEDLEEARGEALTFLAVVIAGLLEVGGPRSLNRVQLEAARQFDKCADHESLKRACRVLLEDISGDLIHDDSDATSRLMDRALVMISRNFATELGDETLANQLGLSTSHFRFLFKQTTGQPFHKYLVSLRLERARSFLEEGHSSISEVARNVGFHGLAHFSRVFTQRFGVSPNDYRKTRR